MPYIKNEDKPSFLGGSKSELPRFDGNKSNSSYGSKNDFPKPQISKEKYPEPVAGAQSDAVSRYQSKIKLDKDAKTRSELAKKLNTSVGSEKFNTAVKDLKRNLDKDVPKIFGDSISSEEERSRENPQKRYWEEKAELEKFAQGGITYEESKEMAVNKIKRSFLDRLLNRNKGEK